jgi:ATP-binding cassette subfamily B (MDR/TAP) protein 1
VSYKFKAVHQVLQVLTFMLSPLQAGKLLQLASAFFGGFIIAFTRGWLLTLVMLTSLPLVAIAAAVSGQMLTRVSNKRLTSYSDAADTVEQTIGSIRTVS